MKTMVLLMALMIGSLNHVNANKTEPTEPITTTPKIDVERNAKKLRLKKFKRSVTASTDLKEFSYHQKMYVVNAPIDSVWKTYTTIKPSDAWKGPLNTFKQSCSPLVDSVYLSSDSVLPPIQEEMVYELNLRIAGLMDVGVAFQITEVDHTTKTIEFTYGEDNASHGRQRIVFTSDGDQTFIIHYSNFKSSSKFRDRFLYPKFHEDCMDEFHANLKEKIEKK